MPAARRASKRSRSSPNPRWRVKRMAHAKKKKHEDAHYAAGPAAVSDINITPLIDVMLVLLIIFMLVTPTALKGVDIALPKDNKDQAPPPKDNTVIVMEVSESGAI